LRDLATGSMLALWRSMIGRDYRVDLATLRVPLLAVLGGGSNLYDAALLGRWFETTVPHAEVVRYPKADHAPHAASPARFARDVAAFAARGWKAAPHPAAHAVDAIFVTAARAAA
jgi:pimeloyl-ACP methyl ester carboxylesterase